MLANFFYEWTKVGKKGVASIKKLALTTTVSQATTQSLSAGYQPNVCNSFRKLIFRGPSNKIKLVLLLFILLSLGRSILLFCEKLVGFFHTLAPVNLTLLALSFALLELLFQYLKMDNLFNFFD